MKPNLNHTKQTLISCIAHDLLKQSNIGGEDDIEMVMVMVLVMMMVVKMVVVSASEAVILLLFKFV